MSIITLICLLFLLINLPIIEKSVPNNCKAFIEDFNILFIFFSNNFYKLIGFIICPF